MAAVRVIAALASFGQSLSEDIKRDVCIVDAHHHARRGHKRHDRRGLVRPHAQLFEESCLFRIAGLNSDDLCAIFEQGIRLKLTDTLRKVTAAIRLRTQQDDLLILQSLQTGCLAGRNDCCHQLLRGDSLRKHTGDRPIGGQDRDSRHRCACGIKLLNQRLFVRIADLNRHDDSILSLSEGLLQNLLHLLRGSILTSVEQKKRVLTICGSDLNRVLTGAQFGRFCHACVEL